RRFRSLGAEPAAAKPCWWVAVLRRVVSPLAIPLRTFRLVSLFDSVEQPQSSDPGLPLGCARIWAWPGILHMGPLLLVALRDGGRRRPGDGDKGRRRLGTCGPSQLTYILPAAALG